MSTVLILTLVADQLPPSRHIPILGFLYSLHVMVKAVYIMVDVAVMGTAMCAAIGVPLVQRWFVKKQRQPQAKTSINSKPSTDSTTQPVCHLTNFHEFTQLPWWLRPKIMYLVLLFAFEIFNFIAFIWVLSYW